MNHRSQSDRSKLRIAGMCAAHLERFRLLPRMNACDPATLVAISGELLDLFEKRVEQLAGSGGTRSAAGSGPGSDAEDFNEENTWKSFPRSER